MTRVRTYLPLSSADVQALAAGNAIEPSAAFAVTERLASTHPGADVESLEYAAFLEAAAAAGRARGADSTARRVIASVDVRPASVSEPARPEGQTPALVRLDTTVALRAVASFHVDEQPGGTDDAHLLWFDASEVLSVRQSLS